MARIFVDVDGTLTKEQRARSIHRSPHWPEMIEKVQKAINNGHEVIIWTGNTPYARDAVKTLGLEGVTAAVGKPDVIIDNEQRRWGRRLKSRIILPEEYLERDDI